MDYLYAPTEKCLRTMEFTAFLQSNPVLQSESLFLKISARYVRKQISVHCL